MASRGSRILTGILGVLGELMITAGLLIAGYLAWDIWWDSNAAAAIAVEHVIAFQEELIEAPRQAAELVTDTDPPDFGEVNDGETFGILIVPEWYGKTNNQMPLVEGTTPRVLDQAAAGHYEQTAMPGEIGNFSIAAHRRTHGNSFRYINDLGAGDQVIVSTKSTWYIYEVTNYEIVTPDRIDVVAPVPGQLDAIPVDRLMTLTTCHSPTTGEWGNSHRWVTHTKLIGWMDRADGMPEQVLNDPGVL